MVEVEGVEVGPSLILVQIMQSRRAVQGEYIQAGDDLRIACFETEIGGLLERRHFAAGMAAKHRDVRLVPRLEGDDLSLPASSHSAKEVVAVAQIQGEAFGVGVRPRGREVVNLQHLQSGGRLGLRGPVIAISGGELAFPGLQFRPTQAVAHAVYAGQRAQAGHACHLFFGIEPGHRHINADG